MAVQQLQSVGQDLHIPSYEVTFQQVGAGTSDTYIIPTGLRRGTSVILEVVSGSGKVQYSTTPRHYFYDTSPTFTPVWVDWTNGVIAATGVNQFGPISALRVITTSGTQNLHVQCD